MEVARGWLEQKKAGALVRWKKQYYILRGDVLSAFTSEDQGSFLQGFLLDADTTVRSLRRDHEQRQYCFTFVHHKILYYFSAPTAEERDAWVNALLQQQQNISPAASLVPRYVPAIHQSSQAAAAASMRITNTSMPTANTVNLGEIFGSQAPDIQQQSLSAYSAGGNPFASSSPSSSPFSPFGSSSAPPSQFGSPPFLASSPPSFGNTADTFMSFQGRPAGEQVALAYQQQDHEQGPRKRKYEREMMQQ